MKAYGCLACSLLLACSSGPRFLDDPDAALDEPVTVWIDGQG